MKLWHKKNDPCWVGFGTETMAAAYGEIKFQHGSLVDHKENGVQDVGVLDALVRYLNEMNWKHPSRYNHEAVEHLLEAGELLTQRRRESHEKQRKAENN